MKRPLALLVTLCALLVVACSGGSQAPEVIVITPVTSTATATATPQPVATATSTPAPPSGRLRLNAVGDLMLDRDVETMMDEDGSVAPFRDVLALLSDADITIANMEGAFTDRGEQAAKFYTFRTAPGHAGGLAEAGIDVVSLSNNHTMDYGAVGLTDTLAALDAAGVRHSGAGANEAEARKPVILSAHGLRIAFLSYEGVSESTPAGASSSGEAWADAADVRADVITAKQQADVIVVSLHAGVEYTDTPSSLQREVAHAAVDAGAALVLGHHPHVLQGWEQYRGALIVYSLGNFVFDLDPEDLRTLGPRPFQTIVLHVELTREGVQSFSATPVYIDPVLNRPTIATGEEKAAIEARLTQLNATLR